MKLKIRFAAEETAPNVPILLIIYKHVATINLFEILMTLESLVKPSHSCELEFHIVIQVPSNIS